MVSLWVPGGKIRESVMKGKGNIYGYGVEVGGVYERESEWFCMCVRACGVREREEGGGGIVDLQII